MSSLSKGKKSSKKEESAASKGDKVTTVDEDGVAVKRKPGRPKKIKTQSDIDREEAEKLDLKKRGRKREKW